MEFTVSEILQIIAALGAAGFFGVKGAKKQGWIASKEPADSNPTLTAAIVELTAETSKTRIAMGAAQTSMAEIAETSERISKVLVVVEKRTEVALAELAILRIQHGEPAKQGKFEDWKNSPRDRTNWEATRAYSSAGAFMAEVSLRMQMATVEAQKPEEHLGSARAALTQYATAKTEFG